MMDWQRLLSKKQTGQVRSRVDTSREGRNVFQRDYDRIIFSTAFRRLQLKTQVIPFPESDHVHNRLIHSLEAACVGRSLGRRVGQDIFEDNHQLFNRLTIYPEDFGSIVAAACLAHDIGNPPLGHSGEAAIAEYFGYGYGKRLIRDLSLEQKQDLTNFEGNALGFRILTHSFPEETSLSGGMGLSYATLASFTKYPKESLPKNTDHNLASERKFGLFQSEIVLFKKIAKELGLISKNYRGQVGWHRHPLAFLVEAADDICNAIMDLEDGYHEQLISFEYITLKLLDIAGYRFDDSRYKRIISHERKVKFLRAEAINSLVDEIAVTFRDKEQEILRGTFDDNLINHMQSREVIWDIQKKAKGNIYRSRQVIEIEAAGFEVIPGLLDSFLKAKYAKDNPSKRNKILQLIPKQYLVKAKDPQIEKYYSIINITQYIASMTDHFAVDLYRLIKGISLPNYDQ